MTVTIPVIGATFLGKLITLAILSEPVDSDGVLGSSPGRSFLHLKSRVFAGLGWVRNVRLVALDLRDLRSVSGGSWAGSWDFWILVFHLNLHAPGDAR